MNRIAVEIGEDRFGHSMNAAVLRGDRFVTDVVSRVLKVEGDLPRVSQILQHREEQWVVHVAERHGELIEAFSKYFDLEPRVLWHGIVASLTVSKTTVSCSARLRST
jgi:hypothetical protein